MAELIKVNENDGVLSVVINFAGYIMAVRTGKRLQMASAAGLRASTAKSLSGAKRYSVTFKVLPHFVERLARDGQMGMLPSHVGMCGLIWWALVGLLRSRAAREAECMALRQQINVLRRTAPRRPRFGNIDRLIFVGLCRLFPSVRDALRIVQPETLIRWHRAGLRTYWRWKSRRRGGRPTVSGEIRRLIRAMSLAHPLWGAPRELLKLGIDIGQTSVAKYMARRRRPPSQGWRTFLRSPADGIAPRQVGSRQKRRAPALVTEGRRAGLH